MRINPALIAGVVFGVELTAVAQLPQRSPQNPNPIPDQVIECEALIAGGGLAGAAAAYESLLAGRTICLTEITDWVGGQISAQGTSALDERTTQRQRDFFPQGYKTFTQRLHEVYQQPNPGDCWVSRFCFLPRDGHAILFAMLQEAAAQGNGTLKWFPSTVVKDLDLDASGTQIATATAIQHQPAPGTSPLNSEPLSQILADAYRYEDSERLTKTVIQFVPLAGNHTESAEDLPAWYVVDATETGELVALADVPYRVGIDPLTAADPSSASATGDPYCTQGYTYTFAMEATAEPQPQIMPSFYPQYEPYYSYERSDLADFDILFTYRRIWSPEPRPEQRVFGVSVPKPGDISMQNWTWGNDYRPGTAADNLILTRNQLQQTGQLEPNGWMGGLRIESLQRAEEAALGFYYWLVAGTTDSQLGAGVKQPNPNNRLLTGLDSPMGTEHGLSKYPYMREVRRIIGRPSPGYAAGFTIGETDITRNDFTAEHYSRTLSPRLYRDLGISLSGLDAIARIRSSDPPDPLRLRTRSRIYPDSVGIGHYNIDFHPCMALSPPELPGNYEYPGVRQGQGETYPFQIPLRAMIPQQLDNFLIAGKSIATSYIAAAAYRVHSFEWSVGAAAGTLIDYALEQSVAPYELVNELPQREPQLEDLQQRLHRAGNPTAFPGTSIFNLDWSDWR
ncbi:MAG: FAD-dependent oxidoreductase [Synechococcales cyanobacterium M58_A2018_015]|nr:FAD-dependent oxidoreductase [Synechococcales cyanobacterium M58_A2018_015]